MKYLYDVTVGFGDAIVQSEVDLIVNGASPKEIHYQIRKIPISDLPQDVRRNFSEVVDFIGYKILST